MHYRLYPWARMNPTIHKFLRHGCEISSRFPLPIAYYADDALESAHKYYRKNMILHARQNSRRNRILDIFNRAVYMSDPKMSLIKIGDRLRKLKKNKITSDMLKYIKDV